MYIFICILTTMHKKYYDNKIRKITNIHIKCLVTYDTLFHVLTVYNLQIEKILFLA